MAMNHTVEGLKIRVHNLKQRKDVDNTNIINKLERKIKKVRSKVTKFNIDNK